MEDDWSILGERLVRASRMGGVGSEGSTGQQETRTGGDR